MTTKLAERPQAKTNDASPRLARRREIRKQIAATKELLNRAAIEQDRIWQLDAEVDTAVTAYQTTCEPLQAELTAAEDQIVSATADRLPIPEGIEARRRELIDLLHAANEKLSDEVERIKRLRAPLTREVDRLRLEAAQGAALENTLAHPDVANPVLLNDLHVARQALDWATKRLEAAQGHVTQCKTLAAAAIKRKDRSAESLWRERLPKWQAELAAASAAVGEARRATDAAHRAVVDE